MITFGPGELAVRMIADGKGNTLPAYKPFYLGHMSGFSLDEKLGTESFYGAQSRYAQLIGVGKSELTGEIKGLVYPELLSRMQSGAAEMNDDSGAIESGTMLEMAPEVSYTAVTSGNHGAIQITLPKGSTYFQTAGLRCDDLMVNFDRVDNDPEGYEFDVTVNADKDVVSFKVPASYVGKKFTPRYAMLVKRNDAISWNIASLAMGDSPVFSLVYAGRIQGHKMAVVLNSVVFTDKSMVGTDLDKFNSDRGLKFVCGSLGGAVGGVYSTRRMPG